jgi:hypothetical protein
MQERKYRRQSMISFSIQNYSAYIPKKPHFFALRTGYNAGRPLRQPSGDCFLVTCSDNDQIQKLFFLCEGVWRCQIFRKQLRGSVDPILYADEFTKTINRYWDHIHESEKRVERLITAFATIEQLELEIEGLKKLLQDYKSIAFMDILKTQKIEF